jgi:hypothetical protein
MIKNANEGVQQMKWFWIGLAAFLIVTFTVGIGWAFAGLIVAGMIYVVIKLMANGRDSRL